MIQESEIFKGQILLTREIFGSHTSESRRLLYPNKNISLSEYKGEDVDYEQRIFDDPRTLCIFVDVLDQVIDTLNERERLVVKLRHGIIGGRVHSFTEIGSQIGRTRERARQINIRSLTKLRRRPARLLIPLIPKDTEG